VTWWQILILCWLFFALGFGTAALMHIARSEEDSVEKVRSIDG
jgi:hypothetical protein